MAIGIDVGERVGCADVELEILGALVAIFLLMLAIGLLLLLLAVQVLVILVVILV